MASCFLLLKPMTWQLKMYVRKNIHWRVIWAYSWRDVLIITLYDTLAAILYGPLHIHVLDVPWQLVSIVGVAVSFYVGFKNSSAYSRFSEARTLWGGIVNRSRSWAWQVLANNHAAEAPGSYALWQHELVDRQIAWVNALRLHLRRQPELWETEVAPFLSGLEATAVRRQANPPAQLLLAQAHALREVGKHFNGLQQNSLIDELRELTSLQGGCERIKTTPFPRQYAFSSQVFVWIFAALLPLGLFGEFNKLGHGNFWYTVPFSVLVSWVFITIELVGHISENPFENRMNDVPMSALCRTIEIDLRQMLGETGLPSPIQPIDGVLY